MGYSIIGTSYEGNTNAASGTAYLFPAATTQGLGTEATGQIKVPVDGTLSNFVVRLWSNPSTGTNSTITLRKNTSDTSIVITLTANGTLNFQDIVNTLHISAGDLINWKVVGGSAASTLRIAAIYMSFLPDDSSLTITPLGCNIIAATISLNAATTMYHQPSGFLASNSMTVGEVSIPVLNDGTLTNFGLYSSIGGRTLTQRVFKNSTDDSIDRAALASNVTGLATYDSNPITVDSDDKIAFRLVWGSSGTTRNIYNQWMWFRSTDKKSVLMSGNSTGLTLGAGNTLYYNTLPGAISNDTDETLLAWPVKTPITVSKMTVLVNTNGINTGNITVRLRKNGADANQLITIPTTGTDTGLFQDLTHTDSFVAGDTIDYKLVAGGTTGSIGFIGFALAVNDDTSSSVNMTNSATKNFAGRFLTKV